MMTLNSAKMTYHELNIKQILLNDDVLLDYLFIIDICRASLAIFLFVSRNNLSCGFDDSWQQGLDVFCCLL